MLKNTQFYTKEAIDYFNNSSIAGADNNGIFKIDLLSELLLQHKIDWSKNKISSKAIVSMTTILDYCLTTPMSLNQMKCHIHNIECWLYNKEKIIKEIKLFEKIDNLNQDFV